MFMKNKKKKSFEYLYCLMTTYIHAQIAWTFLFAYSKPHYIYGSLETKKDREKNAEVGVRRSVDDVFS